MKLTDIIDLAKQGYKPADIKELVAISDSTEQPAPDEPAQEQEVKATEVKEKEAVVTDTSEIDDYKKLIDEMSAKLKDTEEKLSKLQHENVRQNIADTEDTRSSVDIFNDAMRNFM